MADLKRLLRDLTQEIQRIAERNEILERRLASISGALVGTVRARGKRGERTTRDRKRKGRRGAPPKFNDAQALQLRRDYERGATSARLARKYKAALPTILSTLRRAGTTLRRGRPRK
jgi:transposase